MLPAQSKLWSSIGPFPAQDVTKAYTTAFEPEKDIKNEPLDLKKSLHKGRASTRRPRGRRETGAGRRASEAGRRQERVPRKKTSRLPRIPHGRPPAPRSIFPRQARPRVMQNRLPEGAAGDTSEIGAARANRAPSAQEEQRRLPSGLLRNRLAEVTKETKSEPKPEVAMAQTKDAQKAAAAKPKPEKITWAEQRKWRRRHASTPSGRQLRLLPRPQDRGNSPAHGDGPD